MTLCAGDTSVVQYPVRFLSAEISTIDQTTHDSKQMLVTIRLSSYHGKVDMSCKMKRIDECLLYCVANTVI